MGFVGRDFRKKKKQGKRGSKAIIEARKDFYSTPGAFEQIFLGSRIRQYRYLEKKVSNKMKRLKKVKQRKSSGSTGDVFNPSDYLWKKEKKIKRRR